MCGTQASSMKHEEEAIIDGFRRWLAAVVSLMMVFRELGRSLTTYMKLEAIGNYG